MKTIAYQFGSHLSHRMAPAAPPFSKEIQERLDATMPPGIPPLALFATLARDARLFRKLFAGGLVDRGHLTLRQREIVIDRTTALCHCEYEWGVHVAFFAKRVGLDDAQLRSLAHGDAEDGCWDGAERLLIRMCDELHASCTLSDSLWNGLRMHFSEEAMLELLMLAGYYHTISFLANALKLPREPFAMRFPGK